MTTPTHLIMVLNRETFELKLVSAHESDDDAGYAFSSLSSLFGSTPNDVHKVTVPVASGFVDGEILSSRGKAAPTQVGANYYCPSCKTKLVSKDEICPTCEERAALSAPFYTSVAAKPKNGIHRNERGEYVQKFADGSEIISSSDFGDE